jgi:hypothetical protein
MSCVIKPSAFTQQTTAAAPALFGPFGQFTATVGKRVYARMLGSDGLTS